MERFIRASVEEMVSGVSPLMLDDLSSGFNIATHGSMSPRLATLAGFTRADTERAVDEFLAARPHLTDAPGLGDRGALLDVLKQFAERGINMVRIHSRPVDGASWGYLFFVEVMGHATDRNLVTAFEDVRKMAKFFKVLGSYPAAS